MIQVKAQKAWLAEQLKLLEIKTVSTLADIACHLILVAIATVNDEGGLSDSPTSSR